MQETGAGDYFTTNLLSDIEKLSITSGIHPSFFGYHRKLAEKFPFAIYYKSVKDSVEVFAILDLRKKFKLDSGLEMNFRIDSRSLRTQNESVVACIHQVRPS